MKFRLLILLTILPFFSGCLSSLSPVRKVDYSFPEDVFGIVNSNYRKMETFKGKGNILVNSTEGKFQARINCSVSLKDSMCMVKFDGALGIDIATFLLLDNEFEILASREGILYKGDKDRINLEDITYIDIPVVDFFELFTGLCEIESSFSMNSDPEVDAENYSITFKKGEFKYTYYIVKNTGVVKKFTKYLNNILIYSKEFSNFRRTGKMVIPRKIVYKVYGLDRKIRTRVTIVYDMQKVNKTLKKTDFEIKLPENIKTEYLR